ncbi:hypothetical protein [Candidatus Palauibacter sp.]|uniref:hypothetical protein n=1 Tax=Candidatus Palauibacter sp. TaxID=3101350 RepID=UPI003B52538C
MPISALMLLLSVVHGQEKCRVYQRSDFPFIQALHELDSEERKLEHLRSWTPTMGAENGLSNAAYAYHYGSLLRLFLLHHVGDDKALDRESLIDNIRETMALSNWITMNDEGDVAERTAGAGYFPPYAMFVFTLDSLIPNILERLPPPRTRAACPNGTGNRLSCTISLEDDDPPLGPKP